MPGGRGKGVPFILAVIIVFVIVFWVAVCLGPPPAREFFIRLIENIFNI